MFCFLNRKEFETSVDNAVTAVFAIAAGEWDEAQTAAWITSVLENG